MGNIKCPLTEDEQRIEAVLVAMDRLTDAIQALVDKTDVGWLEQWQPRDQRRGAVEALRGLLAVTDHRSLNEQMAGGDECPCDACNAARYALRGQ